MANKVLTHEETALTWKSSAGTAVITLTSLATNSLRVGAQVDRGAAAVSMKYRWRARIVLGATTTSVTIGNPIGIYIATADTVDATVVDGNVGQSDATATSIDKRRNLKFLGFLEVDKTAAAGDVWVGSDVIEIEARYISMCVAHEAGNALSATATDCWLSLTPMPPELQ
jgi:hypothetical protein